MHIWRPVWEGGRWRAKAKIRFYRTQEGGELASALEVQSLFSFIKKNWICAMTRHHAEPNINILLTKNLPFDTEVWQWRHPLMIPLHFLWPKSSIWIWHDLVLFLLLNRSFTFMARLSFHSLFTFSSCANKTGWLQTKY